MKTSQKFTHDILNEHYLTEKTGKIDEGYLNDAIQLWGENTRVFVDAVRHTNRKIEAIVWQMFLDLVNDHVKDYICTSEQLKAWLRKYGRGYETIRPTVDYFANIRREL